MLVLATVAQPTNEISAAVQCNYHCYRDASFVLKTEATFNKLFWPQVSTIVSLYCLYFWQCLLASSWFGHNLMWWAYQLVHAGDDSKQQRASGEKLARRLLSLGSLTRCPPSHSRSLNPERGPLLEALVARSHPRMTWTMRDQASAM